MELLRFKNIVGYLRRPDPVIKGVVEHFFQVKMDMVPDSINTKPNARIPDPTKAAYKLMKRAQRNDIPAHVRNVYHMGSSPITIFSVGVKCSPARRPTSIALRNDGLNGLVDAGNQYHAVLANKDWFTEHGCDQYINIRIVENVPSAIRCYLIQTLNTHTAVKESAMLNLGGVFEAIKEVLFEQDLLKHFGCRGNEQRVKKLKYDIGECVTILALMDRGGYPSKEKHPSKGVGQPWGLIRSYGQNAGQKFANTVYMLPDFLRLYERIRKDVPITISSRRNLDAISYINGPKLRRPNGDRLRQTEKVYRFPVIDEAGRAELFIGCARAMLSAFRQLIAVSAKTNEHKWEIPFEQVLGLWDSCRVDMVAIADKVTTRGKKQASEAFKGDQTHSWSRFYECVTKARENFVKGKAVIKGNVVSELSVAERVRVELRKVAAADPELTFAPKGLICALAKVNPASVPFPTYVRQIRKEAGVLD